MTGITQTVPNYFGGISEQPDYIKEPGQVRTITNGIPDLTYGLYKRPGSKRIGTTALSAGTGGSWFHYYRDETEGSYIGRVASDGDVKVWRCSDGFEMTTLWSTDHSGTQTNLKAYLATSTPSDLKFLTINDTTFVNNSNAAKTVSMGSADTESRPHTHAAFVELTKTENGRQYSLNLNSNDTVQTIHTATRLEITSDTQTAPGAPATGHCPGNGTRVFDVDGGSGQKNMIGRLTVRGQQGSSTSHHMNSDDSAHDKQDYGCTYINEVILLHGGEGWEKNHTFGVSLEGFSYTITVTDSEATKCQANLKAVRPAPTPFDADTAVSATHILGGIASELDGVANISYTIIGNGIYIYSDNQPFNVQVVEDDLMKVITLEANDVTDLPVQCKHGYIVKVANTESQEDDYYLKFKAENNISGNGVWVECAKPGMKKSFDQTNMPVTLARTSATEFTVSRFDWQDRDIGDEVTNPEPTFVGKSINRVLFWRNRLVFLAGKNAVISRPGDFGNFWVNTALTVSASDPIDIACSTTFPSTLYDGIELPEGLLIFSSDQQFLLTTGAETLNPENARLVGISTYNYNKKISPISLGSTTGFIDNTGQYARFFEMANVNQRTPPDVINVTKAIPTAIPNNSDLLTNSRENSTVIIGKSGESVVQGYRYHSVGNRRLQSAWFKWNLVNPIKYHFVVGDKYYFVDDDNFLQQINLVQAANDPLITQDSTDYLLHLDNYTTLSGGVFNATTRKTTWSGLSWLSSVNTPNGKLAIIDDRESISHLSKNVLARYNEPTVTGTSIVADGDWADATSAHAVTKITVTNGGSGYTSRPTVAITNTSGSPGSGATATAEINSSGVVTEVTMVNFGGGYSNGATVAFSGGGGSSAAATATVTAAESPIKVGYLYEFKVEFPKLYPSKAANGVTVADVNASLVLHRVKINLGKVGMYESTLSRLGKKDYTELIESTLQDTYDASDAPYLAERTQTIPVYEKNTNVNLTVKSSHPSPATIRSLSWEGDYTNKFYRRA